MTLQDWQERYEQFYPRVYRALRALGARPDEAEDALQDAFDRGLRQRAPITSPEGWLFVVASRRWRASRARNALLRPLAALSRSTPPPGTERLVILEALARLPLRQRQVFVCRYVLDLSQQETAAALGMAQGTVSSTTAAATRALRGLLDDP